MQNKHPESYTIPEEQSTSSTDNSDSTANNRKRAGTETSIFRLRSKKERSDFLQSSIPDWIEAQTMMDINHPRAQRIHKSIFEWMLIDRIPFSACNNPGFLRHHHTLAPNFDPGCDKYYRNMLSPTHEKIRDAVKTKLHSDSPPLVCVGLDGWSKFHQVCLCW